MDDALRTAVREVERHAASTGWDRDPALFALVETSRLLADEPAVAASMGLTAASAGSLTAVPQDALGLDRSLPDALAGIDWPPDVVGAVLVLETVVLPPAAEQDAPEGGAASWAAGHPDREEARVVVGVLRSGAYWAALRWRRHDHDEDVLTGDLAPALTDALASSFR